MTEEWLHHLLSSGEFKLGELGSNLVSKVSSADPIDGSLHDSLHILKDDRVEQQDVTIALLDQALLGVTGFLIGQAELEVDEAVG